MDKFRFNHFRRAVIYVILGLPLLLFPLIFPVKVRCSSCPFLNIVSKEFALSLSDVVNKCSVCTGSS